jgi:elongation factor Ts
MEVTTAMVKALREKTGAGILDSKKALEENNGDIDAAAKWLTENGLLKAAKKSERVAAEGLTGVKIDGGYGVIYEVNSETDFVAQNDIFKELIATVGEALLASKATSVEAALASEYNGETLESIIVRAISVIGEKITLRRFTIVEQPTDGVLGSYIHMGGKISVLTAVKGTEDKTVADNIAMHIAGINPLAVSVNDLPQDIVESKKIELTNETKNEGKPDNIVERIVEGRMSKFFAESVLLEQAYVKEPDMSVAQYLTSKNAEVLSFTRYAVGEGIEKQEVDFATEVMSQVK